jgi:hypothetical protein
MGKSRFIVCVVEYDGSESIEVEDDIDWLIA